MSAHRGSADSAISPQLLRSCGWLLLLSGWGIVLTAFGLLHAAAPRAGFVIAGVAVELLGFALVIRSHGFVRRKRT